MMVIAGVDEVGRGALAGPVVAAAVVLPPDCDVPLRDSKAMTPTQRRRCYEAILRTATAVAVASRDHHCIDTINILQATLAAMADALSRLPVHVDYALVDGNQLPPGVRGRAVVRGDQREPAIQAASIVAKVVRDRWLTRFDRLYRGYGFAAHKGYATLQHRQALLQLGVTPIHRRSFAPVRDVLAA